MELPLFFTISWSSRATIGSMVLASMIKEFFFADAKTPFSAENQENSKALPDVRTLWT
jgi:hypothetical protein